MQCGYGGGVGIFIRFPHLYVSGGDRSTRSYHRERGLPYRYCMQGNSISIYSPTRIFMIISMYFVGVKWKQFFQNLTTIIPLHALSINSGIICSFRYVIGTSLGAAFIC